MFWYERKRMVVARKIWLKINPSNCTKSCPTWLNFRVLSPRAVLEWNALNYLAWSSVLSNSFESVQSLLSRFAAVFCIAEVSLFSFDRSVAILLSQVDSQPHRPVFYLVLLFMLRTNRKLKVHTGIIFSSSERFHSLNHLKSLVSVRSNVGMPSHSWVMPAFLFFSFLFFSFLFFFLAFLLFFSEWTNSSFQLLALFFKVNVK